MSMCRVFLCVVGRGCLLWPVCSLSKTLWAFALLHFVLKGQICLLLQVFLDFLLLHSSPPWWKGHLFLVLVLGHLVGLHRTVQLLQHSCLGIDLDYCDVEWFALERNRDHSVILKLHPSTAFWRRRQWHPTPVLLPGKIPWTEEPGRLQSMGLRRVGHDWMTSLSLFTFMHWRRKWQPTPVFLPGESQG